MCEMSLFRNEPGLMPVHIENLINGIAAEEEISNFDIAVAPGSFKGDNYLGQINQIRITGTHRNDHKEIALVVKISPSGKHLRDAVPINKYYRREIQAYSKVFPAFCKLPNNKLQFTKYYKSIEDDGKEIVILEDLCYKGFRSYEKNKHLDKNHLEVVIKALAQYHGSSFALQKQNPDLFVELASQAAKNLEYHDMLGKVMENTKKTFISSILENRERIAIYLEDMIDQFESFVKPETSAPYNVLCHGDCWTNNFLFLYDIQDENIIKDIRFLDWQLTRLASPVTDIAYMIYSSTDEKTRSECLDYLLDLYYDTLKSSINSMGFSSDDCYPEHIYRQHIKTIMPFGLITSFMVLPVFLTELEEGDDAGSDLEDESKFIRAFSELCDETLRKNARDFLKSGLL